MHKVLIVTLSTLLLAGCMAEWKPADHPSKRTALEGQPGVTCARASTRAGSRLKNEPLCLTQSGWAQYDNRQRVAGINSLPALYPDYSSPQVAPNGNPPPAPAWNPN